MKVYRAWYYRKCKWLSTTWHTSHNRNIYWCEKDVRHLANKTLLATLPQNVHRYVVRCKFCKQLKTFLNCQLSLKLFPPSDPLKLIGIDTLGRLLPTKEGNTFIFVMTDHFTNDLIVIPVSKTAAPYVAAMVVEARLCPLVYLILLWLIVVVSLHQSFPLQKSTLWLQKFELHQNVCAQDNGWYRTLARWLRHYFGECSQEWNAFFQPTTYANCT